MISFHPLPRAFSQRGSRTRATSTICSSCASLHPASGILGQADPVSRHHFPELQNFLGMEFIQQIKNDAVSNAVMDMQDEGKSVGKGMADTHLGIGDAHSAEVGGHHQLVGTVRTFFKEDLPAEIHGLFAIGLAEGIQIGTRKRFNAMDIAIHSRIKPLVHRHSRQSVRDRVRSGQKPYDRN